VRAALREWLRCVPEPAPHLLGKLWRRLTGAQPAVLAALAGLGGTLLGITGIALDAVSDGTLPAADAAWMLCVAWAWVGVVACVAVLRGAEPGADREERGARRPESDRAQRGGADPR
jgi:hypothetical protein